MSELFIRKFWIDENVLFYLHFINGQAVEQIEVFQDGKKVKLSLKRKSEDESFLYDQSINELELQESDYITAEEFYKVWD